MVIGLAFFMEGLFLAIMPLSERCGLRLPARAGIGILIAFAAVLGITATFAEPAIGLLKAQGSATLPWRAPLLYYLLNEGAHITVGAVATGVGFAVMIGLFRFLKAWNIKFFLFTAMPFLLAISWLASLDPRTVAVLGLAWDSGSVTTGPVTVPLVIALGLGVSRITGRGDDPAGSLGVVAFAVAMPITVVMLTSLTLAPQFPKPVDRQEFFSDAFRPQALRVAGTDEALQQLARIHYPAAWHGAAGLDAAAPDTTPEPDADEISPTPTPSPASFAAWRGHITSSFKAVLPLVGVLLFVLLVIIRERPPQSDEFLLGLVFALIGMLLFSYGMEHGLSSLGNQAGQSLPRAWAATERPDKALTFTNVDESLLVRAARPDGTVAEFLPAAGAHGPEFVPFDREHYHVDKKEYRWIPEEPPVAGQDSFWGYALVLFFVFAMGMGATLAEPSLNALGITLEELTTGTYKRMVLVLTVALGVGCGLIAGFGRILLDWPLIPMLTATYGVALVLTAFSSEEITAIAWDSGGVTTGPITVPLVIAAGLGIGQRAGVTEAFGVVAMANVFPIISVLLSGFVVASRRDKLVRNTPPPDDDPIAIPELEEERP